ncbi:AraC family transcriptional regulator [Paenibacillus harenae]|uniref:AraC family transcriptional regulator n=1 Tax=Paenibacillus harenae TaxID=306543 RepID=UPI0004126F8B|nr:AraC family transcriptional regulator [Paenibacillus harenae]
MVDLNELAGALAKGVLTVEGIYRTAVPGKLTCKGHTKDQATPHAGFLFALKGTATFTFNGIPYELEPGKLVHGGKGMELQLQIGEAGFEYFLIHYALRQPNSEGNPYESTHFMLEIGKNPAIAELLQLLQEASSIPGHFAALRMKELFYSIMREALTGCRNRMNQESRTVIRHALEYLHNHYMEPLTLPVLAGLHDMEVKPFAYLFNKYVGLFPIDYLIQHRMKRAKQQLVGSGSSVRDIAESVGYGDAHYFSRLFKKHIGMTPSEFRASVGNYPPAIE